MLQNRSWDWSRPSKHAVCVKLTWQQWHHCESSVHWTWSSGWVEPAQQTPPNQGPSGLHDGLPSWLWEVEENLFSPDKNFHYKTSSTSISNTFHWLSLFPMDGGFPCLTSTIIIIIIIMIIVMMITNIIIRSVLSKFISQLVKLLVLLGLLLSPTPSLQVHGYFELCCCWLIV